LKYIFRRKRESLQDDTYIEATSWGRKKETIRRERKRQTVGSFREKEKKEEKLEKKKRTWPDHWRPVSKKKGEMAIAAKSLSSQKKRRSAKREAAFIPCSER